MISEVEKILKGSVVKSQEYDTLRKLIGVANQNLVPNANGDIALAKQRAFIVEKKDTTALETLDNALNQNVQNVEQIESLNLESNIQNAPSIEQPESTNKFTSELNNAPVLENPIQVENPNTLTTLSNPLEEAINTETIDSQIEKPKVIMDLQMPQMPENIIATEPIETNNSLFEPNLQENNEQNNNLSETNLQENKEINNNIPEPKLQENEEKLKEISLPSFNELNIELPKMPEKIDAVDDNQNLTTQNNENINLSSNELEINNNLNGKSDESINTTDALNAGKELLNIANELNTTITNTINAITKFIKSDEYKGLVKVFEMLSKSEQLNDKIEQPTTINTKPQTQNSLVDDAMNQINNMFISPENNQLKL